jgi:general secretion pathway protein K
VKKTKPKLTRDRGVAMLLVVISIVILTVVATEFAYNTRVDLTTATNNRDEVRAYFLARSGLGMSRLLLKFQKQLDNIKIPNLAGLLGGAAGGGAAAASAQPQGLSIQLWRMAKVDCYMLQGLVTYDPAKDPERGGIGPPAKKKSLFDDEEPELAERQAMRSFGGFEGCFNVTISDEEEKINVSKFDAPALSAIPTIASALELFSDKRFEFLFEREDSNRVKVTPQEVIIAIRDWIDEDNTGSQLNLSGQGEPFVRGFSDENGPYQKLEPRYNAKNGRFDSLDELYLVHGVNDRFMAAFRDRLTVYPDPNSRLNVNTDEPLLMAMAILAVADPARPDPRLRDPVFIDTLIRKIRTARMFAVLGMSVTDFLAVVESAGVAVNSTIRNNVANQRYVGDKSSTFRITSRGEAGSVVKTLTAVVIADGNGLGKLVHWREE